MTGYQKGTLISMLEIYSGEFSCHQVSPWENARGNLHLRTEFISILCCVSILYNKRLHNVVVLCVRKQIVPSVK